MRKHIINKLSSIDAQMSEILSSLESYSEDILNKTPLLNQWSVIQILHHLIISERLSLSYCQKKLSFNPKLKRATLISSLKVKLLNIYMISPLKFQAPRAVGTSTLPSHDSLENIKILWTQERKELKYFIDNLDENFLYLELYKHPAVGRLSLLGMLQFFEIHIENHKKQINSTINIVSDLI